MRNVQMVKYAKDQVVHQGFNCLRSMIKPGAGGNYVGTSSSQAQHILQVNGVVGSLAGNNYQPASFFERYIRGPMNQICAGAGSNCRRAQTRINSASRFANCRLAAWPTFASTGPIRATA